MRRDCAAAVTRPAARSLIVNQGDVVTVTLHNNLPEATGLLFQGQAMVPDTHGRAQPAARRPTPSRPTSPGTYLYEAAPLPNAEHQVAMGLYGALIVRPGNRRARPTPTPPPPSTTRRCWS